MSDKTAEIYFDSQTRSLRRPEGDPVVLRAKSFSVFLALAKNHPDPISKEQLIEDVWGQVAVSDDSITQCIADVRRALGDKAHALVQTNPGIGYRLTVPAVSEGATQSTPAPATTAPNWWVWLSSLAVLGVIAGAFLTWFYWMTPTRPPNIAEAKPAVAVLTLDTLGHDPDMTIFAQALRNDVVVALSALETVSVLSPSILNATSAPSETPVQAYAAKGADYVVGGTIQASDAGVRVSAHLIDTANSKITWVRRWENADRDLISLQDDVGQALAVELANPWSGQLTGLGADAGAPGNAETLSAGEHIRLGVALFHAYHGQALTKAEQHFRKALEIDAQNAEAWAGLSFVLGAMLPLANGTDIKAIRDARANSGRQAYHLGQGSGRSLLAGSWTAALRGNETEKRRRLLEAADKLAGDADALALASLQGALTTELTSEAILWGEQALSLNSQAAPWYHLGPGIGYFFNGDHAQAISHLEKAPQDHPSSLLFLAAAFAQQNDPEQAARALAQLRMLHHDVSIDRFLAAELLSPASKAETLRGLLSNAEQGEK